MTTPDKSALPVLVLASQSPRRRQLLQQIGFDPLCLPADINEEPLAQEMPDELVLRLAGLKARACSGMPALSEMLDSQRKCIILAADTIIDLDGQIMGKPRNKANAVDMLQKLSGREHRVHTAVTAQIAGEHRQQSTLVSTSVRFANVSRQMAENYWQSGEPDGKAGSYAIQGIGAQFVVHLSGSYSNVVGLPLYETSRLLERVGLTSL